VAGDGALTTRIIRLAGWIPTLAIAAALYACAALREREIQTIEEMLAAAGFTMKPADTPEKMANLRSLPPHELIVQHRDGQTYYVYADPDVCRCVWLGDQQQYASFQQLRLQKQIADEQLLAAQIYRDAALRWDFWGRWPWW
jgi:hypothetical protein